MKLQTFTDYLAGVCGGKVKSDTARKIATA